MLEYVPISEFSLRWRFAKDATRWTVLPEADLQQLHPLSESCSRKLWYQHVSSSSAHLMAADVAGLWFQNRIAEYRSSVDWSEAEEAAHAAEFLRQHLPVQDETKLLFFWSASCGVETSLDLLLRYWSDFCYPSDDSNVIVPAQGDRIGTYVEGLVCVVSRGLQTAER